MTPRLIRCTPEWTPSECAEARDHIRRGGLVVLPTDTVYGIGTIATDAQAVQRLLAAKGRGRQMPPPVLVAHAHDIDDIAVEIPDSARRLAHSHWPGALTLILRARPDLGWDLGDTHGTIALRMPDHAATRQLLEQVGPMAVTSANLTGQPPATTIDEAIASFAQSVLYIDGGPTPGTTPSTIIDFTRATPQALRCGAVSLEELSASAQIDICPPN